MAIIGTKANQRSLSDQKIANIILAVSHNGNTKPNRAIKGNFKGSTEEEA